MFVRMDRCARMLLLLLALSRLGGCQQLTEMLGLAAFAILRGNGSNYRISGLLGVGTPFGPLEMPCEKSGETRFR